MAFDFLKTNMILGEKRARARMSGEKMMTLQLKKSEFNSVGEQTWAREKSVRRFSSHLFHLFYAWFGIYLRTLLLRLSCKHDIGIVVSFLRVCTARKNDLDIRLWVYFFTFICVLHVNIHLHTHTHTIRSEKDFPCSFLHWALTIELCSVALCYLLTANFFYSLAFRWHFDDIYSCTAC